MTRPTISARVWNFRPSREERFGEIDQAACTNHSVGVRVVFKLLVLPLFLVLCNVSPAQLAGQIQTMKLVTEQAGWTSTGQKLSWTADGGSHWTEITPKLAHKHQTISSVYFLDASVGWVLLKCADDLDSVADEGCWNIAFTVDAGQNWSITPEKIAVPFSREYLQDMPGFSGQSWLQFSDLQHGWEVLDIAHNSATPSSGMMLRTTDGGKTWATTKDLPLAEQFRFINPKDGWITGGPEGQLFVTHNAGDSWSEVSPQKPKDIGEDLGTGMSLPSFEDRQQGSVIVRYSVGPVTGPDLLTVILFTTKDGGKTWRRDATLSRIPTAYAFDAVGSVLIAAPSDTESIPQGEGQCPIRRTLISLRSVGPNQNENQAAASVPLPDGPVMQVSFVSPEHGWAMLMGRLLSTEDAGHTWGEVTPGGPPPNRQVGCVLNR